MWISLFVLLAAIVMVIVEARAPGRQWPKVRGWWLRAAFLNILQVAVIVLAGVAWDRWMLRWQPWSGDVLGVTGGAIVGYLVITFIFYWWHRWRHQVPILWRWVHQLHHSPQRIEVITAFYKHPLELVADSILSSAILYLGLGLGPGAAAGAVLLSGLGELFYHWNVKTPHWLGRFVQRPEMHCIHHQDGLHRFNYSDLPLWDMLFGTYRNPKNWRGKCGFGEDEERLGEMLAGRKVQ